MHKKQLVSSRISHLRQPGTTLFELLIGVTIILLLFGAVLGTLSQGFIAINMSRTKTRRNAQGITEPETTIQKPENNSHLVTTGGLNKTIGYNASDIDFTVTPATQKEGVGYVKIDNSTNADYEHEHKSRSR